MVAMDTTLSMLCSSKFKHAAWLISLPASLHPLNFRWVIDVNFGTMVVGDSHHLAQGTKPAELQAVEAAREYCKGAATYVNMTPGDCHAILLLCLKGGIASVVVGDKAFIAASPRKCYSDAKKQRIAGLCPWGRSAK